MAKIDARTLYSAVRLITDSFYGATTGRIGGGSGFIVTDAVTNRYLVTNRHVLDRGFVDPGSWELASVTVKGEYQTSVMDLLGTKTQELTVNNPQPVFPTDRQTDLAVLPLDVPFRAGQSLAGTGVFNSLPVTMLATTADVTFGRVGVNSTVVTPGYPEVGQEVADRPILVRGVIATDPRYAAEVGGSKFPGEVLCHSFSWNGMSGSPVLVLVPKERTWDVVATGDVDDVLLAGVNAGHIKTGGETAGVLTRFVQADALATLLSRAGAQGVPTVLKSLPPSEVTGAGAPQTD
ncbi:MULTISPECIES: trypsin-like peptidase domain-containing protein [Streptacidiphilus]|uniref:Trypsin-like peptidase domain-containing protein n=1 Tax=Streptacidiphilus cavernicola TaxID=3342716 RepID=A0ABV6V088_9ACTN|nr:trypsin-like peptidase domain-containing protein [Streptacidiphilus jeojiense]